MEELSDYFAKALRADAFREGLEACLHFPQDDVDTWEVMLHWAIKRTMPVWSELDSETTLSVQMRCWVMGDKYQATTFQDEIMVDLLKLCSTPTASSAILKQGVRSSTPRSPLRKLMAEELVYLVYGCHGMDVDELDELDGFGLMSEFVKAHMRYEANKEAFSSSVRFGSYCEATLAVGPGGTWKEFLVGKKIPRRAWKWDVFNDAWVF